MAKFFAFIVFALFACLASAAPEPKAKADPQFVAAAPLAYSAPLTAAYSAYSAPVVYPGYASAYSLGYNAYPYPYTTIL